MPPPMWDGESGTFAQRMTIVGPPVIAGLARPRRRGPAARTDRIPRRLLRPVHGRDAVVDAADHGPTRAQHVRPQHERVLRSADGRLGQPRHRVDAARRPRRARPLHGRDAVGDALLADPDRLVAVLQSEQAALGVVERPAGARREDDRRDADGFALRRRCRPRDGRGRVVAATRSVRARRTRQQ